MDCCILSTEEVGRLVHYGLTPSHDEHSHIDPQSAILGLADETFEMVGERYITRTKMYYLVRRKSLGVDTIQRVLSNQLTYLKPIR